MSQDLEFNKNEDHNKLLVSKLKHILEKVSMGGGKSRIEKLHAQGKMSARERIAALIDENSQFLEIGALAGYEMYEEHGGCPSGGVVGGIGYVSGRQCVIVANDATVKAGAWFPITGKKNLRFQEIAMENRLPIIYLVDSAGVYLPMQDEIFPDKNILVEFLGTMPSCHRRESLKLLQSWAVVWLGVLIFQLCQTRH